MWIRKNSLQKQPQIKVVNRNVEDFPIQKMEIISLNATIVQVTESGSPTQEKIRT